MLLEPKFKSLKAISYSYIRPTNDIESGAGWFRFGIDKFSTEAEQDWKYTFQMELTDQME